MPDIAPGTIVVYSDVACPWATIAVHRLCSCRSDLGLDDEVTIDHRAFVLEITNEQRTPWKILEAEIPVVGALEPSFGFQMWQGEPGTWPVTALPALESVQAAKKQSLRASEQLDLSLRRAFFCESRCISLRHVIRDVAERCPDLDVARLVDDLDHGAARADVMQQTMKADDWGVAGSPHLFMPDGSDMFNPGVDLHWVGEHGEGFPVVDADDPGVYADLLARAAATR